MSAPTERTTGIRVADVMPTNVNNFPNRSKAMHLMHEDLARAHRVRSPEELLRHDLARRTVAARKAQRRAERAVARANRLLALASIQ